MFTYIVFGAAAGFISLGLSEIGYLLGINDGWCSSFAFAAFWKKIALLSVRAVILSSAVAFSASFAP